MIIAICFENRLLNIGDPVHITLTWGFKKNNRVGVIRKFETADIALVELPHPHSVMQDRELRLHVSHLLPITSPTVQSTPKSKGKGN